MNTNSQTNNLIKWFIILIDFIVLNLLLLLCRKYHPQMVILNAWMANSSFLMNNLALMVSEYYNSPIIHRRIVSVGDILQRIFRLSMVQMILAFLMVKIQTDRFPAGKTELTLGVMFLVTTLIVRFVERRAIKAFRAAGRNTRSVTFIGSDPELLNVYSRLEDDISKGYRILGYYADDEMTNVPENIKIERLGTLQDFLRQMGHAENLKIGDEMYVSISRREGDVVRVLSHFCDKHVIRFYFVPMSVETLGIGLKRELLDDIEVFATYENPLENPVNMLKKRLFDIVLSLIFLLLTSPFLPFIWLFIKLQSPGPLLFKQVRTGLDGKDFNMLKFRSMHVNSDADRLQATKDDPRKYPFGDFMRKANIDELPQFWNVLKGDMSIVGPRPHMLAHTEQYSQLIDKYMVRHFVKPGVTGWAQVTGFRGETKELWQMEGRVKRDIWYIEHWSIWLDIRIIWMTLKSMIVHDKNAY